MTLLLDRLASHTGAVTLTLVAQGDPEPGSAPMLPTTLRNLFAAAAAELEQRQDLDPDERGELLGLLPDAQELADATPFGHGAWVAVSADGGVTHVPLAPSIRVAPMHVIAPRAALLRPLLEHERGLDELLLLTLSENGSDLAVLDVASRQLTPVGAPFPQAHPGPGVQTRAAGARVEGGRDRDYWRGVAADAHRVLEQRDLPLVTVGVERAQAFLRAASRWPNELAITVTGSPEQLHERDLVDAVLAAAAEEHDRRFTEVQALFDRRMGQGRVLTGMTDLYQAATQGRIELLQVAPGAPVAGFLTPSGHLVADDPGDGVPVPHVLAEGMAEVVLRGGRVELGPADQVVEPRATLRW